MSVVIERTGKQHAHIRETHRLAGTSLRKGKRVDYLPGTFQSSKRVGNIESIMYDCGSILETNASASKSRKCQIWPTSGTRRGEEPELGKEIRKSGSGGGRQPLVTAALGLLSPPLSFLLVDQPLEGHEKSCPLHRCIEQSQSKRFYLRLFQKSLQHPQ